MNETEKNIDDAFRRYYRPLCLYAMHYLYDMDLVEDIVQDCFTELWERSTIEKEISNVKAYLYIMVRNHCYDILKKDNPTDCNLSPFDLEDVISDKECEERSLIEERLWRSYYLRMLLYLTNLRSLQVSTARLICPGRSISLSKEMKSIRLK